MARRATGTHEYTGRTLLVRRLIGVGLIASMIGALIWFFVFSGFSNPLQELTAPYIEMATQAINGKLEINWGDKIVALAAILFPHIGFFLFMFDEV